jgi:hypothetical protein
MDLTSDPRGKGLEFPLEIELMAFGANQADFIDQVLAALLSHGAQRTDTPISTRVSSGGKYISVHVPVHVESRAELERLYGVLQSHPGVKFRL